VAAVLGELAAPLAFPDDFEQFRNVVRDLAVLPQNLVDTLATLCGLGLKFGGKHPAVDVE
jgi:hypothetical protein